MGIPEPRAPRTGDHQPAIRHVVFVGLMASGKSSVGRQVADMLRRPFVDNDRVFESESGCTAREYADRFGQEALHRREWAVLRGNLARPDPSVIGAAASVADRPTGLRNVLGPHDVVYLWARPEVLARRATEDESDDHRPVADTDIRERLRADEARRGPTYRRVATIVIDVGEIDTTEAADAVVAQLTTGDDGPR